MVVRQKNLGKIDLCFYNILNLAVLWFMSTAFFVNINIVQ